MSLDQILVLPTWAGSQYVFANEWYKRILFCFNHCEHNAFSGFKNKKTEIFNILSFYTSYNSKKKCTVLYSLFWWKIYFTNFLDEYIYLEDRWITYILKIYVTTFLGKFACFEELDILGIYEREYTTRKSPISTLM